MKLYKYTTAERGLQILDSNLVVLSHPQDFNDPYDSFPKWDEEELDKACSLVVDFGMEINIVNFFEKIFRQKEKFKGKMITSIVLKEYRLMKKLVKKNPSKYTPVLTLDKLNKVFYLLNKLGKNTPQQQEAKIQLDANIALKREEYKEKIRALKNLREELLIACFSSCKDSNLMWAHYADSHKGVCIEFDIPKDDGKLFKKVIYSKERPTNNFVQATRIMCGQLLANGEFDKLDKSLEKLLVKPYLTKLEDWAYEKEYRIVFSNTEIDINTKLHKIQCTDGIMRTGYEMPQISAVYTGVKYSENIDLIKACERQGVDLIPTNLSQDTYSLS